MTSLADLTLDEIDASLCVDSLAEFVQSAWPIIEPGAPLAWGWALDAICEHLEAVTRGEIKRLLMNIPPRHMKTLLTSVFWPAWEWLRDPTLKYLTVSYASKLAIEGATFSRTLMQSEGIKATPEELATMNHGGPATLLQRIGYRGLLQLLGKDWDFSGDTNLKSRYQNTDRGLRVATGLVGESTGQGGNRIIIDDPHKIEEADSENKRKAAVEFVTQTIPTRVNTQEAAIVVIMQRVHEEDVTAALLEKGGYTHLCLPERFDPKHPHRWPRDPRTKAGEILFPERFDEAGVQEHETIGPYKYAANYDQLPAPAEGGIFKAANWGTYNPADPADLPPMWERVLCTWDLTFGENQDPKASFCVGQIWGKDGARAYLLAQIRARMSFDDQGQAIIDLRNFAPDNDAGGRPVSLIEKKADGQAQIEHLTNTRKVPGLKPEEPKGSKLQRAIAIEPFQSAGNLLLPIGTIPCPSGYDPTTREDFIHEFKQLPNGKHDDQIDAASQGVHELYNGEVAKAAGTQNMKPPTGQPVTERGGKRFVGKKYVDVDPSKARKRRRGPGPR